jgi:heat shock protein HslJ
MVRAFALLAIAALGACASTAQPPSTQDQIAGRWIAVSVDGLQSDTPPAVTFLESGQLDGGAMCNALSGPYRIDADAIVIEDIEMTLLGCRQPPDVARQHSRFLAMLHGRLRVETVSDDSIELRAVDGSSIRLSRF